MRLQSSIVLILSFCILSAHTTTTTTFAFSVMPTSRSCTSILSQDRSSSSSFGLVTIVAAASGKKDGFLAERNEERIRMAGRRGTKRFIDPTKVFLGNLPFDATEADVKEFFATNLGTTFHIKSVKIIRDWKTQKSKGYGFCLFTDPIYATSAMEVCNGKELMGRPMTLSQGQKKQDETNELYLLKQRRKAATAEDQAIQEGLQQAEDDTTTTDDDDSDNDDGIVEDEFDAVVDKDLFHDDEEEEDEDDFDGVFEEMYPNIYEPLTEEEQMLNRDQRRDASKRKRRRKMEHKGFEPPP